MSGCGPLNAGWALLMVCKVYIGYNRVADSTANMQLLTCRVDSASARGGAQLMRAHGTEAARPVPAVHTCHKCSRKVLRFCSLAHLRQIGRTTVSGCSNRMWSVPHRVMLKFELPPRPAIRATGPCRM